MEWLFDVAGKESCPESTSACPTYEGFRVIFGFQNFSRSDLLNVELRAFYAVRYNQIRTLIFD